MPELDPHARIEPPRPAHAVLAFDFGLKRIGIAAGDTLTCRAAPRLAAAMLPKGPEWAVIDREVRELAPRWLVVGIPYNAEGGAGRLTEAARRFGTALGERYGLEVEYVDERWSSLEAGAALKRGRADGSRTRRVRREHVDSAAAAVILERWLAGERAGSFRRIDR
ncbi:MAG TPA: Holliday junction resolvase RuvX [Steroidobacteraceae bacterium]|jgi:putative Holliday junction resolvase